MVWRKIRMVGYHGLSSRWVIQRQSGVVDNGTPTYPSRRYSGEHAEYNAHLKQQILEYADFLGVQKLNDAQMMSFIENAKQGLNYLGEPDAVIGSFNAKVAAEAEAYQAGIAARVPNPNLTKEQLIEQGEKYIKANPARFKGLRGLGGAVNAMAPVQIVVGGLADARDQARGYTLERGYDTTYFHNASGTETFIVQSVGCIWTGYTYYKVFVDERHNEVRRVEIPYAQFKAFEAEVERLYGYWNWWGGFVPGTLRKTPPVIRHVGPYEA